MTALDNRRGIAAMLTAAAVFSLMDAGLKHLSPHYPAIEVAALRSLASLPFVLAWVGWRGGFGRVLHIRWGLHLLRGMIGVGVLTGFVLGVRRLPLAEAYALFFVAPLLITALSALILKERVDRARWIAVSCGLLGVLIVLRPTGQGVATLSGLAVLGAAAGYAVIAIIVRILGRTDSRESLVLWPMVMMSAAALVPAAPVWVPVRLEHAGVLVAIAVAGSVGQIALTEAFRGSEASAVAPFEYTGLAWSAILDWVFWRTLPDSFTLLGGCVIVGSGVYLARREAAPSAGDHP